MRTKLEDILNNLEKSEALIIGDQTFLNEVISIDYLQYSTFGTITFSGMEFKGVNFSGSNFVNSVFKNCKFQDVVFQKCDFWDPIFENCQIQRCDFTKAAFQRGTFLSCDFLEARFIVSIFNDFKFIETKFKNCDLASISAKSSRVWKSNQSTLIDDSLNLGNFLEVEDTISNPSNEAS